MYNITINRGVLENLLKTQFPGARSDAQQKRGIAIWFLTYFICTYYISLMQYNSIYGTAGKTDRVTKKPNTKKSKKKEKKDTDSHNTGDASGKDNGEEGKENQSECDKQIDHNVDSLVEQQRASATESAFAS